MSSFGLLPLLAPLVAAIPAFAIEVREAHYVMGTVLEITVEAPSVGVGRSWIREGVAEARRLDRELTSFDPKSALSRLNRAAGRGFRRVPPDLFRIVALSQELSGDTDGAFDITVGPLVRLWSEAARDRRWPTAAALAASRSRVGYEKIHLRAPDQIELTIPGMALELGGVGKGYAADRIAAHLRSAGASAALVSFGGSSIVAIESPHGSTGWPIWVRREKDLQGPMLLRDAGLSTSRVFAHSRHAGGRAIGHIFDPRTGEPVARDAQATVIAPTATAAEAWSKSLLLEPTRSLAEIDRLSGWGCVLFANGRVQTSRAFAALAAWAPESR